MKTDLLDYNLPEELIAQLPSDRRSCSRLLVLDRKTNNFQDRYFSDILDYLNPGDCLVMNNTKVLPARFYFLRSGKTKMEALFLTESKPGLWEIMVKNARRVKPNDTLILLDKYGNHDIECKALEKTSNGNWIAEISSDKLSETVLNRIGFAPLPPYIRRDNPASIADQDLSRYQTVYAQKAGAVAAPTAGLHFDKYLLAAIENKGVRTAYLTLHVGTGTFKPVQTDTLEEHIIHSEFYEITPQSADIINSSKQAGGKIISVGTTSVRTLETAARQGLVYPAAGTTNLFIKPGFSFQIVDTMITNFHLPRSTLLALAAAFAGLESIMKAYTYAIEKKYRFYSYGDAMLII